MRAKRKKIVREINKISKEVPCYEVCTFNYKETLKVLDQIYRTKNIDFHINISPLGSKMQSLGLAYFCFIYPDVSVYFALPEKYNPTQYSENCKAIWHINFDDLAQARHLLNKVGQLKSTNT
jgi:hypothetical protein